MSQLTALLNRQIPQFDFRVIASREYIDGKQKVEKPVKPAKQPESGPRYDFKLIRASVLRALATGDRYSAPQMAVKINKPSTTARRHLERLAHEGIVRKQIVFVVNTNTSFYWME